MPEFYEGQAGRPDKFKASLGQGRDVTASISACEADCAGANPVALTIFKVPAKRIWRASRARGLAGTEITTFVDIAQMWEPVIMG